MTVSTHIEPVADESEAPSEDELFDVLANRRRRYLIELLAGRTDSCDIGTVATRIAARENGVDVAAVTNKERKRVYTALQQSHLPKMDTAGIIEFDKQRGEITPQPGLDDTDSYLREMRRNEPPWRRYYLGLTVVSLPIILAVWSGLWPFNLLSPLAWSVAIVAGFGCVVLLHDSAVGS